MSGVEDVILGTRRRARPTPQAGQVVEGVIKGADATGATFVVPSWDGGRNLFGPAPWPMSHVEPADHDHAATAPPVGSRCLVVFVGTGIDNPWIIGWWPS